MKSVRVTRRGGKKVAVELKWRGKLNKKRWGWRLAWWASSTKRAADGRRQRSTKITYETREKYKTMNRSLQNTFADLRGATFVILKNHANALIRKEISSPTSKARKEVSRNNFVKKNWAPDRFESF